MLKFIPIPIDQHESILGKNFSSNFTQEMQNYYAPFIAKQRQIQIAKETWEYGVADSIPGSSWVGAGKNVVDVITPMVELDVKGISVDRLTSTLTTEASFLQNNKGKNDHFATLFKNADYSALNDMFVSPWLDKVKNTKNLHLMAIIREKSTHAVYYCLLKIVNNNIDNNEFIAQMSMDGSRSVDVPLIESAYGKTYIYMPKRRLEIRLNCQGLKDYLVYSHHCR
jgi:hypothetical protein